jgi:hypothetical protein
VKEEDIQKLEGGGDWHTAYICLYRAKQLEWFWLADVSWLSMDTIPAQVPILLHGMSKSK